MTDTIPLARPDIGEAELSAVAQVMASGTLSRGPMISHFEQAASELLGGEVIAVSSGTAALHLLLKSLDIKPGDEVILPSFTVPATANVVAQCGARVVFADIDAATWALDASDVAARLTDRTRAVIAVHPFGVMTDLKALQTVAGKIPIIEDACEAFDCASTNGVAGRLTAGGACGFYPNKAITTGEGGLVIGTSAQQADMIRLWRNHGRTMDGTWLDQQQLGFNYRLSDLHAALGVAQLRRWPDIRSRRISAAEYYRRALANVKGVQLQDIPPWQHQTNWFSMVVRLSHATIDSRDRVVAAMQQHGVQCGRYFAPLHLQPCWGVQPRLPITEAVAAQVIALPYFSQITRLEQDRVIRCLKIVMHDELRR